jgi:hypothetical protein
MKHKPIPNSSDNVIVAGGNLKITAKKVGSGYTRLD